MGWPSQVLRVWQEKGAAQTSRGEKGSKKGGKKEQGKGTKRGQESLGVESAVLGADGNILKHC